MVVPDSPSTPPESWFITPFNLVQGGKLYSIQQYTIEWHNVWMVYTNGVTVKLWENRILTISQKLLHIHLKLWIWIQLYPLYWIEWCNDSGRWLHSLVSVQTPMWLTGAFFQNWPIDQGESLILWFTLNCTPFIYITTWLERGNSQLLKWHPCLWKLIKNWGHRCDLNFTLKSRESE